MNCFKCATPLPDHSKFCMACGADVSGEGHMHETMRSDADPELMAALQLELGNDYTIERELGRGGMAIVYLGQDTHLGRKVAVKLLPPMLTFGSGPGFIERFKREARTSATLDHPHIIPVYRVSTGGKLFWYVMKFLQGESLDETLKRDGKFEIDKTVGIIDQVADALDYAHSMSVVHRDIKPANMMIDKKGWVTVTDFGIAKALNTGTLTGSGAAIGTPHYMSPEQCVGVGVTGASDQYALGVTAYQLLSGELPFKADSILELMRMHSQDPPPPLEEVRPDLPRGVIAAIERALAKDPLARFESCGDFSKELLRWTRDLAEAARRPTAGVASIKRTVDEAPRLRPTVKPRPDTPARVTKGATPPPTSNRRMVIGVSVAAAAIIGAFGIYKVTQSPSSSTKTNPVEQVTPPPKTVDSAALRDSLRAVAAADSIKAAAALAAVKESTTAVAPRAPTTSRLELHIPRGATVTQNGRTVRGVADRDPTPFLFDIPLRRATVFVVSAPGFDSWRRSFSPSVSDSQLVVVSLIKTAVKAQPEPTIPVVTGTATIVVGSRPTNAAISINGKAVEGNPTTQEVPAGRVTIRFNVIDSAGAWTIDTVRIVAPGERLNLGRIILKRPQ
jgi:serine/threonine protein kinase